MENKNLEYIILYLIIGCSVLVFAAIVRHFVLFLGFDSFSASVIFLVTMGISAIIYLSINLFLQRLMLPWISKILQSIPFLKNKTKRKEAGITEDVVLVETVRNQQQLPDLDQLRKEHLQAESKKQNESRQIAICYTQTIFAPYTSDEELKRLCHYIDLYALKRDPTSIIPIRVSDQLHSTDIYHFGWNIWNHFRVSSQSAMASFLKSVFAFTLKDISDVDTIKKKLRVQDGPCTIPLQSNLKKSELID